MAPQLWFTVGFPLASLFAFTYFPETRTTFGIPEWFSYGIDVYPKDHTTWSFEDTKLAAAAAVFYFIVFFASVKTAPVKMQEDAKKDRAGKLRMHDWQNYCGSFVNSLITFSWTLPLFFGPMGFFWGKDFTLEQTRPFLVWFIGYMIYDFTACSMHGGAIFIREPGLFFHHVLGVLGLFGGIWDDRMAWMTIVATLVELNSITLHFKALAKLKNKYLSDTEKAAAKEHRKNVTEPLNIATYFASRFVPAVWLWLYTMPWNNPAVDDLASVAWLPWSFMGTLFFGLNLVMGDALLQSYWRLLQGEKEIEGILRAAKDQ